MTLKDYCLEPIAKMFWDEIRNFRDESLKILVKTVKILDGQFRVRPVFAMYFDEIESHQHKKSHVPAMLKPIAKWHDAFRHEVLDVL